MNVKETIELISYLKDRRDHCADMRNYYQEQYSKACNPEETALAEHKDYYKQEASKDGMEVSRLDYFIRILEQIEVTR